MIRQFGKRGLAQDIEIERRDTHQARQGRDKIMLRQVSSFPGSRDTETQTLTAPAPGSRIRSQRSPTSCDIPGIPRLPVRQDKRLIRRDF